jgi:cytochrome b pre-mRNA-processing protein 3
MALLGLFGTGKQERAAFGLYVAAVAAAREPYFYDRLGVADSLDGRFDLVGLHVFLLIRRLRALPGEAARGPAAAQALFDAMFSDMDHNLRELGVGDLTVGKRVRAMWEAFHGRCTVYETALAEGDRAGLAAALARNVWRGEAPEGAPATLARIVFAQDRFIRAQEAGELLAGRTRFLDPAAAAAAEPVG